MAQKLNAAQLRGVYELFNEFALEDQRRYYKSTVTRFRKSSIVVSRLRAGFALLTGLTSAAVGLVVSLNSQTCFVINTISPPECASIQSWVDIGLLVAVVAPAIGSAFTTLADLYQWDRMIALYESALENLDVADAQSPVEGMDEENYRRALLTYAEGTLMVMSDETAQWGQLTKPPQPLTDFVQGAVNSSGDIPDDPIIPPDATN